jgi:FAD:protein FMN transferase
MRDILRQHSFSIAFLLVLFGFVFFSGNETVELQRLSGYTMGTSYDIQLVEIPEQTSRERISADVESLLASLDKEIFSTYAANSELSRFNRHGVNVPFIASTEMIEVLQLARQVSELSDGAFDVTIGPLVNLWGFGPELRLPTEELPGQQEIDTALAALGYQNIEIDAARSEIRKKTDVYVDLSAIAKGYAVDKLADYFDEVGVDAYFLEIGGELKIKGLKPGGISWIPAIEAPLDTASRVYEIFFSHGDTIGVAGSGDYRNYFEQDGIRYSHELDPPTGRPVTHNLAAVYVIDPSAAKADALATAYMVLGLEQARVLAESQGQAAYFIYKGSDTEFDEYVTAAFKFYLDN